LQVNRSISYAEGEALPFSEGGVFGVSIAGGDSIVGDSSTVGTSGGLSNAGAGIGLAIGNGSDKFLGISFGDSGVCVLKGATGFFGYRSGSKIDSALRSPPPPKPFKAAAESAQNFV
jgi:hypothetical protein